MARSALTVLTSARTGGLSQSLAHRIHDGLTAGGVTVEQVDLSTRHIEFCRGCHYECLGKDPACPVCDDVPALWQRCWQTDLLTYIIPTYGGLPPAQFIAFQQRVQPLWHLAPEQDLRGRLLNIIVVASARGAAGGELTVQAMINVAREDPRSLLCFETLLDPHRKTDIGEAMRRMDWLVDHSLSALNQMEAKKEV